MQEGGKTAEFRFLPAVISIHIHPNLAGNLARMRRYYATEFYAGSSYSAGDTTEMQKVKYLVRSLTGHSGSNDRYSLKSDST